MHKICASRMATNGLCTTILKITVLEYLMISYYRAHESSNRALLRYLSFTFVKHPASLASNISSLDIQDSLDRFFCNLYLLLVVLLTAHDDDICCLSKGTLVASIISGSVRAPSSAFGYHFVISQCL